MKILITGGTGFVGTNLLPLLLEQNHEVVLLDNLSQSLYNQDFHGKAKFHLADIRNSDVLHKIFMLEKPDVVFHLAGLVSIYDCHKDPVSAADNNIMGTINVFNAALNCGCKRVIFSETSAVYEGCELPSTGFSEDQSNPTTFYSTTKAAVALIAESYARTRGLQYTALRYFNITGPIQDYRRTVPPLFAGVALRLLGGNNPIIFGDGTRRRDFIHVDDVNRFHLECLTNENTISVTFNLGTGKHTSLFEISEIIHEYLNVDIELNYDMMPEINGEAHTIFADIYKAKLIGWEPTRSIKQQIYDTIDYLKSEIDKGHVNPKTFMTNLNVDSVKI
jgi:nucleoside-diphosphate-sugar epimerase